ncbi:hypothetical protein [Endozoicomonas lisbonensis]|uniref:hypothetical protein n=1 Tax=Endozoicomonas lisbonensis TaxID=3120522 RepID=UPI003394C810
MKVEQSLMVIERYISRCWREQPSFGDCNLTYTEYDYLETLEESGMMRLSELAGINACQQAHCQQYGRKTGEKKAG